MPDIRFTLFDSDNFYQQGLRLLLQDYLHSLNECHRLYPQFSPLALQALDNIEIVLRTPEERWGCASCYQSPYGTPRQRQLTLLILDDATQQQVKNSPPLFSIHRRDSAYAIRLKLQMALEKFIQHPWVALHAAGMWKCQACRIAALSHCEKKVLGLMSSGMSACSIAGLLQRSQKTISAHKRSAMRKLNVRKTSELNKVLLNQRGLG
ncbi:hypothetical protein SMQE30_40720 [Serratia marcescens]|nr:hypothetical protein SMQE30_40720 [Serratia marcescens]